MELQFQNHDGLWFSRSELQWLVQWLFLQEVLQKFWIVGVLVKVCILCNMEWSAQNRRPRQVEFWSSYQLILVRNDASSQTLVNRIVSVSDAKSWLFSRKLVPDTCFEGIPIVLLLVISHMLIHLWPRILSVFLVPFLPPSNRIVHTNSKLLRKYWADLQNEWSGIRVRCSKHPHWSVWCLCHSSFSEFHN